MPISEYILLALLATGGVALPDGAPATTLGADAIVQPNGGESSSLYLGQDTPPKKGGRHQKEFRKRRRHSKVYHHTNKQPRTPKKDGG
jgi:hypothetical protein